jgi:cation transport ATPase
MPQVEHTDDSVHSLVDVDSPHISSVTSDFESQSVKTDTQAERIELENEAREKAREAAASAQSAKEKAKAKAERGSDKARKNADNPVVLGNAATAVILGSVLGVGAYRKYVRNELTWKVVGAWAGVVGLFGVADYYVSNYFFQKYPPKK